MKKRLLLAWFFVAALSSTPAISQTFPTQSEICVAGIVSKEKLARAYLKLNSEWYDLYVQTLENTNAPRSVWRRMFVDPRFCDGNPACDRPAPQSKSSAKRDPIINHVAAENMLEDVRTGFRRALQDNTRPEDPTRSYSISKRDIGVSYFSGDDRQNAIQCIAMSPSIALLPKSKPIEAPANLRLRGTPDDLVYDSRAKVFDSLSSATIQISRDGSDPKTNKGSFQAALGYALDPVPFLAPSDVFSYQDAQLIPYLSATQSITKVAGKQATLADTNNVAVGMVVQSNVVLKSMLGVSHVFAMTPQYLWNTKDRSEIFSVKAAYEPWTDGEGPQFNSAFHPMTGNALWMRLLFDLHTNVGEYRNVGTDAVTMLTHTSFVRSGSRFGVSFWTPRDGPHMSLTLTETMLYGFIGSVKQLSYFDSSLSYYFDQSSRFAFTLKYTKGQNEDTAEWDQKITASLSAKF